MPEIKITYRDYRVRNKTYKIHRVKWRFTKEERREYEVILTGLTDEASLKAFLSLLEDYCKAQYEIRQFKIHEEQRQAIKYLTKIMEDSRELLDILKDIRAGKNYVYPYDVEEVHRATIPFHIREKAGISDPVWSFNKDMRAAAGGAIEPLVKFIDTAQKIDVVIPKDKTKKQADKTCFIQAIARLYLMYIGKPTTSKTGHFSGVVSLALKHLELPWIYPERAIGHALKCLKKGSLYQNVIKVRYRKDGLIHDKNPLE